MPKFYQEVDAEVEVDVIDFFDACSDKEINILIKALTEDGYIHQFAIKNVENGKKTYLDTEWDELTNKFSEIRMKLTKDDDETLRNILKKY